MQVTRHRCDFRLPVGAAIASASAPLVGRELWAMLLDEAFRVLPTMVAKGVAPGEVAARQLSGAVQRTLDHTTPPKPWENRIEVGGRCLQGVIRVFMAGG